MYDVTTLYSRLSTATEPAQGRLLRRFIGGPADHCRAAGGPGRPVEIGWEGNKAETTTMLPIIRQFQERHSIEAMVVVADAGCCPRQPATCIEAGLRFIEPVQGHEGPVVDLRSRTAGTGTRSPTANTTPLLPGGGHHRGPRGQRRAEAGGAGVGPGRASSWSWRAVWAHRANVALPNRGCRTPRLRSVGASVRG